MEPKPPVTPYIPDDADRIVWVALGVEDVKPYFEGIKSHTGKLEPLVERTLLDGDIESLAQAAGRMTFIDDHDGRRIDPDEDSLHIKQLRQYMGKQKKFMTPADRKKFNKIRVAEVEIQLAPLNADFTLLDNGDEDKDE